MAQNVNINRDGAMNMLDNMPAAGLQDYTDATREYKPSYERPDWRVEAVRAAVLLVSLAVAWALFGLWRAGYCWDGRNWLACERIDAVQPVGALAAVLLIVGLPAWRVTLWGLGEWRLAQARAARVATSYNRFGNPVRVDLMRDAEYQPARYAGDVALKKLTAPYEWAHSINNYSPSNQPATGETVKLPPEAPVAPIDSWLPLLNDPDGEPHIMLAGKTKAGKSTMAELILAARVERGDEVFIIDPHYQPVNKYGETTWCGLRGVGGASWDAVSQALAQVRAEYDRRKALAEQGQMPQPGGFPPLSVFVDEALETCYEIRKDWEAFQTVMGSGGRKYSIFLVMITQSHLVKDIGGSTATRENFVIIGLGEKARKLIDDEVRDRDEAAAMIERLRGEPWAAAMLHNGVVMLLDRSEVRERRPKRLSAALWQPGPVAQPADAGTLIDLLRDLRDAGWTREQARSMGLSFSNDQWTLAGG